MPSPVHYPPPAETEDGTFNPVPHDHPTSQIVLGLNAAADDAVTASVTAGSPFFKIVRVTANKLILQPEDTSDLPGSRPKPQWLWDEEEVARSNGVTPLPVKAGQRIELEAEALIPNHALPPGPFAGKLVLQGKTLSRTVALAGTYLAVVENSPIGRKWQQLGGEQRLGEVRTNAHTAPDGRGTVQEFANGVLYEVPGSQQVFFIAPAVYAKWLSLSTAKTATGDLVWNTLGFPAEDTFATTEHGQALRFQGGTVVIRANQRAYVVYGAIYARYAQLGDLANPNRQPVVGLPVSDEQPLESADPAGPFRVSHFDTGDIYCGAGTGAHEVHGAIRQHWLDIAENVGYPVTDETVTPDGIGRFNRFQYGMIYWTPSLGAHALRGAILDRWSALGFEQSYLGYPTAEQATWANPVTSHTGVVGVFQNGQIGWTSQDGVIEMPASVTQNQQVLTPDGTALGGWVNMTLKSNGDFAVQFHMHDSGATGYDFQVRAIFTTPSGVAVVAQHSGSVGGTFTSGSRDDDYTDTGNNPLIRLHWPDIQNGRLWVTKDYSATGVIGFFQDVAQAVLNLASGAAGGALGIVIGIGGEIGQVFGHLGLGAAFGVVAGVIVYAYTGSLVLAIVAGVAVGAVTNALIKQRQISQAEYDFANTNVFQGTLPPSEKIVLTNLSGLGGRAFTMPGVDGRIYVNLGDVYGDPLNDTSYGAKGQLLIHELTHAWQIAHSTFVPGLMCQGLVNQANYVVGGKNSSVYVYGPPNLPWGSFNLEAQGAIVDQWFGGDPTVIAPNRRPMDPNDPYFGYIATNIRKGQT